MRFEDLGIGGGLCRTFSEMIDSGKIPHAIMLHEDDGGGGVALALAFLQYLYCRERGKGDSCGVCGECRKISGFIHPDLHVIFPVMAGSLSDSYMPRWRDLFAANPHFTEAEFNEAMGFAGKSPAIAVAQAKSLLDTLSLSSLEGGYSSVLTYLPEKMTTETANRLLKSVEEPPAMTQFIFVTHAPEKVLTTISSRCQHYRVPPADKAAAGADAAEFAEVFFPLVDAVLRKNLTAALDLSSAHLSRWPRERAKGFCKFASDRLREVFLIQQGIAGVAGSGAAGEEVKALAGRMKRAWPRMAESCLDRTRMLIERNVNLDLLFADLVVRLYSI